MKKYQLIMSDLDNTLLPLITQETFVEIWFRDVARKFREHGLDPAAAVNAMNDGCRAIIDAFYEVACKRSGYTREQIEPVLDDYYRTTFANVREIARENPYAPEIVRLIRKKADYAVIATMPMFPYEACDTRMRWVGISADQFDMVTTCDYSSYCKPNPQYYAQILEDFGVKPQDALMIGNDVREDMEPCEKLGIDVFLVEDYMITHGREYARYRHGRYPDLIEYLNTL